jgi:hypothetical protein
MQNQLIAVTHNKKKSLVELRHDDKKMTIHLLDHQLRHELSTTEFYISDSWELETNEAEDFNTDSIKDFFIHMLEQRNDLVNCFG